MGAGLRSTYSDAVDEGWRFREDRDGDVYGTNRDGGDLEAKESDEEDEEEEVEDREGEMERSERD